MRHVIAITAPGPAATLNDRLHWRTEAQHKKEWRTSSYWAACAWKPMPRRLEGCWAVKVSYPVKSLMVRRDPHNWVRTSKWIIDGLVLADVFEDDDEKHVVVVDAAFHTKPVGVVNVELEKL